MNPALLRRRRRRGGAAAFSPLSLSPLVWLDAGSLVQSDGSAVSTWTDSSGNGHDANGADAPAQPTYKASGINSLPSVRFVATSGQYFDLTGLSGLTAAEVFVVLKRNADPPLSTSAAGLWWLGEDVQTLGHPWVSGVIFDDAFRDAAFGRLTVGDPSPSLASPAMLSVASKAGEWTMRVNGTVLYTTAVTAFGNPSAPVLGKGYDERYMDGLIAQFLVFSTVLTSDNRTLLQNWAISKYGIV